MPQQSELLQQAAQRGWWNLVRKMTDGKYPDERYQEWVETLRYLADGNEPATPEQKLIAGFIVNASRP